MWPHQKNITLTEKILSNSSHIPVQGNLWRCTRKRESRAEIPKVYRSLVPREKGYSPSIEMFGIFSNSEQITPREEGKQLHQISLKRKFTRDYFFRNKRSKMNMQELRVGSADMAQSVHMVFRESNLQIHAQRVELPLPSESVIWSFLDRENVWFHTELEDRERALPETRCKTLQEMEELKKISCTQAERSQQLTTDKLSRQVEESHSKVNHFTAKIRELQDKATSLNEQFQRFP